MFNGLKYPLPLDSILPNFEAEIDIDAKSSWILVSPHLEAKNNLSYIQEIGHFYAKSGYYTQRSDLPSYLFLCTIHGQGELQLETAHGAGLPLLPGTICWIDCNHWHRYACAPSSNHWEFLWLHAYGGFLPQYFKEFLRINGSNLAGIDVDVIKPIILSLLSIVSNAGELLTTTYQAAGLINTLSTQILLSAAGNTQRIISNRHIQDAIQYINQNYARHIGLEEIANHVYLSKHYFHRLFTQTVNCTPHEYIHMVRLRHAKELLRNSSLSVREIATSVGFENDSYFIQLFKRSESTTPLAYRKKWNGTSYGADKTITFSSGAAVQGI